MSKSIRLLLGVAVLLALLPTLPAFAQAPAPASASTCDPDGAQSSGAVYRICMPALTAWNGDLLVYAHGYVAFNQPIAIPEDQLTIPNGPNIPDLMNRLGFAFAVTSYSTNGLAVKQALPDLVDLVALFTQKYGKPRHVYLGGVSEGGVITALAVEKYPAVFDGGIAACGPVGDFAKQINYWGDFRLMFDYFFPGVLPPEPFAVPNSLIQNWDSTYVAKVKQALAARPQATAQLIRVTKAPFDPFDPTTIEETVQGLLWYNVFATNDGIQKLGGLPFDNTHRIYLGSSNDLRLNRSVPRFSAAPAALAEIAQSYRTTGRLQKPLVTLHTTGDPIVPYWHETLYYAKTKAAGAGALHTNIPVLRYGHCSFKTGEILAAFALLVWQVTRTDLPGVDTVLPDAAARQEYMDLIQQHRSAQ